MSLRKRKEIQEMSRSRGIVFAALIVAGLLPAQNQAELWKEYGLVHADAGKIGKLSYTACRMKDLTGSLAAWVAVCNIGRLCNTPADSSHWARVSVNMSDCS